jgi:5-methyltetrahydrofolate--homocysteine methyltransferase
METEKMGEKENALVTAIADLEEDQALALVRAYLAEGMVPQTVLDLAQAAMQQVGARFEKGEYFLPALVLAGEMLGEIAGLVKPLLAGATASVDAGSRPTVLIGTVEGDLHDIGKNIVIFMLDVNGFNVVDLGINVPVQTFVDAVRQHQPVVIGLSGFLTLAFDAMKDTVKAIEAAGLRQGRKIMIGGGQVDETVRAYCGADAFGRDAMAAVTLCKGWVGRA